MNDDSQQAGEPLAFSFSEAADKLHCSVSAVRRLVKSGILKGFSLSGGSVLTRVTARLPGLLRAAAYSVFKERFLRAGRKEKIKSRRL